MNVVSVVVTMWGGGDTKTLLAGKKKLNIMHSQAVGMQKLQFSLAPGSWC